MRRPEPITSRTNARVKALRTSLSGEARKPGDLLGLEGEHLVKEASIAGQRFETIFLRQGDDYLLQRSDWPARIETEQWAVLSRDVFDSAVSTTTPQGVVATWRITEPERDPEAPWAGLLVENLQDPGNMGTLIRSATAFGTGDVVVTPDSVNVWSPKVVRAAAGSMFRTRVRRMPLEEAAAKLRSQGVRIFAAVSALTQTVERGVPLMAAPHGVLTGRRLHRDAPEAMGHQEQPWGIPSSGGEGYPASLSYDTDFSGRCAFLIGNEGAGLTATARALADEEVMIPCGVESLNAAVAGAILMYEAMRQIPLRDWARKQGLRP